MVLLTLLLLVSLGYLLTRHIANLVAATRRVAQGDFSSPIQFRSGDEIGVLADNFNQMAASAATNSSCCSATSARSMNAPRPSNA